MASPISVSAYWQRIGVSEPTDHSAETLRRIHRGQLDAIAYENIDIQLGRAIRLDAESLWHKMIVGRRGGFCYELNGLLAWALRSAGFGVRVVAGAPFRAERGARQWGRHMVLLVEASDRTWVADAGLGDGFREPLPLTEGEVRRHGFTHRLRRLDAMTWRCHPDPHGSVTSFDFDTRARDPEYFAEHCRWLSTDPTSSFVRALTVQRPHRRWMIRLRARTLSYRGPTLAPGGTGRLLRDRDDFAAVLWETFGLRIPRDDVDTLWRKACAQHDAWEAASSPGTDGTA